MEERHNLRPIKKDNLGQASVEYLLTLVGVFIAMAGTAGLFAAWIRKGFDLLVPFLQDAFFQ
jgi:Flp pilus assembly pilin Flp